jgi:hypothetical protein
LDYAFWTLYFACPAHQTLLDFDWNGFAIFHFEDTYWACVNACPASGAFGIINYYLHHFGILPILEFQEELSSRIKSLR